VYLCGYVSACKRWIDVCVEGERHTCISPLTEGMYILQIYIAVNNKSVYAAAIGINGSHDGEEQTRRCQGIFFKAKDSLNELECLMQTLVCSCY